MTATEILHWTKLFVVSEHPDKLRQRQAIGTEEEVPPELIEAATAAVAAANMLRNWLKADGRERGEL